MNASILNYVDVPTQYNRAEGIHYVSPNWKANGNTGYFFCLQHFTGTLDKLGSNHHQWSCKERPCHK